MKVSEAKEMLIRLISDDIAQGQAPIVLDPASPDPKDPGKFMLNGKVARAVTHFSGWFTQISASWFKGAYDPPVINGNPFHYYVFAIPPTPARPTSHYLIVDYLKVREWTLEFAAPGGNSHQDHVDWRADIHVYPDCQQAYFRWGDESKWTYPSRVVALNNASNAFEAPITAAKPGGYKGGESEAHKLLKQYVADNPALLGLNAAAEPTIEYYFQTGDHVDVMFENHMPNRTVVEVELAGEKEICIGIHQAIKYRALASSDVGYPLMNARVHAHVVAFDTEYDKAIELGTKYDVNLLSVDRETVLHVA
jgi:hypothetical protein